MTRRGFAPYPVCVTSLRKFSVALTALACAGLLGCGSGGDKGVTPALPPASVSASPSTDASAPNSPGPTPSSTAPAGPSAPDGSSAAPNPAAPNQPAPTAAPNQPAPSAAAPNQPAPNPATPNQPAQPSPGASLPSLPSDPAKALADSGPKGQAYLQALHAGGVPSDPRIDGIYILFAQATCQAEQRGNSRDSILQQFDQIGTQLAGSSGKTPRQISELFVSAAEKNFC